MKICLISIKNYWNLPTSCVHSNVGQLYFQLLLKELLIMEIKLSFERQGDRSFRYKTTKLDEKNLRPRLSLCKINPIWVPGGLYFQFVSTAASQDGMDLWRHCLQWFSHDVQLMSSYRQLIESAVRSLSDRTVLITTKAIAFSSQEVEFAFK